jgi:hypothetical protein
MNIKVNRNKLRKYLTLLDTKDKVNTRFAQQINSYNGPNKDKFIEDCNHQQKIIIDEIDDDLQKNSNCVRRKTKLWKKHNNESHSQDNFFKSV